MELLGRFLYWLSQPAKDNHPIWMDLIPIVSIVASAGVAIFVMISNRNFSRQLADRAYGQKILPSLIFIRRTERIWSLENIGDGTAFNVSVWNYVNEELANKVDFYPLRPGEKIQLDYLRGADRLVATFCNMYGEDPAFTVCFSNMNSFHKGVYDDSSEKAHGTGHESDSVNFITIRKI